MSESAGPLDEAPSTNPACKTESLRPCAALRRARARVTQMPRPKLTPEERRERARLRSERWRTLKFPTV
jgi:hypothetical protein